MKEYSTFQERHDFEERVFEVVQEYLDDWFSTIEDSGISEKNDCLCVNPKTFEISQCKIGESPEGWDIYHIEQLICQSENDLEVIPNTDAIFDLASTYFIVR